MIANLKQSASELILSNGGVLKKEDMYSRMKYPRILPLMRFTVDQYDIAGFGHIMLMHTTTKMGMELITMSLMPSESVNLPYLLIDAMSMKKKRCVFAEYYGCGQDGLNDRLLKDVFEKHKHLPDYDEKDNWYVKERMPYSLIKTGTEDELVLMALDTVTSYLASVRSSSVIPEYKDKLKAFRERMIVDGNPSSKTLNMLLKEDGSRKFMENVIMPLK